MKAHPRLSKVAISDRDRIDHIPRVIEEIMCQLDSNLPDCPTDPALTAGALHGEVRREQGYSLEMLVDDNRILDAVICNLLQGNLLTIELSNLIPDLNRIHDSLEAQLQGSLTAFTMPKTA